ncbi:MAG: AsmA-like C-terminal domain-containing protein [Planctomycetia bacterium]|nr:MAG: AsmA-like C-terminal domain-containing protein [Planctomycetia bacterium]
MTSAEARRQRRRRWIERRAVDRHPVSLTRYRASLAMLLFILLGGIWYTAMTRDRAIQQRVVEFLQDATGCEVRVGSARFSLFGGITLRDVRIATPYKPELDPRAIDPDDRQIVSAESIQLIHNPWLLFIGRLRVEELIAVEPRIRFLQNVDTGAHNWQFFGRSERPRGAAGGGHRPKVRVRSARAIVASLSHDAAPVVREEELDADVRPHPTSETGYFIEVRRYSEPAEHATVVFDPGAKTVTNAPFVDARTVRLQLPKAAQQLFEQIDLQGDVKLTRMTYEASAAMERNYEIALRNVRCRIPLSMLRSGITATQPANATAAGLPEGFDSAVTMTGVQGRLKWSGTRLELDVAGMVNDATCQLEGTVDAADRPLGEMGFDVRFTAAALPAPEGPVRAELLHDPSVPYVLRAIFVDYDPHGVFDVDLQLRRAPGEHASLDLHGTLKPLGVRARSAWFPYEVTDLTGLLRFDGPIVRIEGLNGRHGPAALSFHGTVDQRRFWSQVAVDIRGRNVPLEDELRDALSPHHQAAWRRITPTGAVDLNVRLERAGSADESQQPPWRTRVDVSPVTCAFSIANRYEISDVCGRLAIEDDLVEIHELVGRRGDAVIRLHGRTAFHPDAPPESELTVQAFGVPLDDALASILPPEGRGAFAQFQPSGRVDVNGTILLRRTEPTALYDLRLTLRDGLICYRDFPYRVEDVTGDVLIQPEGVSILRAQGRHGQAAICVTGDVRRRDDGGFAADLSLACESLPLDQDLYTAFPASLQSVWQALNPSGTVAARTHLHCLARDGKLQTHHQTHLTVRESAARLDALPLPLTGLSGEVRIGPQRVEILGLTGRLGDGRFRVTGDIDLSAPRPAGLLSLRATDLKLDDSLFAALPGDLCTALRSVQARGTVDLYLDPLRFAPDATDRMTWYFDGSLTIRGGQADLGLAIRDAAGSVRGSGRVDPVEGVSLNLRAALRTIALAGWPLEDLTANVLMEAGRHNVQIDEAAAGLYGGQVTGVAEIDLGRGEPRYRASITAHDLQVNQYLAASEPAKADPEPSGRSATSRTAATNRTRSDMLQARGDIYGNLILRGRGGTAAYREGAGELYVRSAQIWKLPLLFAIFQVLNLTPDENVFHDGRLKFFLSKNTLTLQTIDLQGRAVSFVGGGTMNLATRELDVTLLAGSPVRIRVPFLTDLLEGASRELMEVRLRGTVEEPTIHPQPLRSLKEILRGLFPKPPEPAEPQPLEAAAQYDAPAE